MTLEDNWRSWPICVDAEKRDPSAFISPDGDWYNVPYGLHETFAAEKGLTDPDDDGWFEINKTAWCYVHYHPNVKMAQVFGRINLKQFQVLKEFWKDQTIFSGYLTIEQLYYQQRS